MTIIAGQVAQKRTLAIALICFGPTAVSWHSFSDRQLNAGGSGRCVAKVAGGSRDLAACIEVEI
jgi:hypothetical protein